MKISADEFNAHREAARFYYRSIMNQGGDNLRAPMPERLGDEAVNDYATEVPIYGVVKLSAANDKSLRATRPDADDIADFGIAQRNIAAGAVGGVAIAGITNVAYDDTETPEYETVEAGARLGSLANSFYAAKSEYGNMLVLDIIKAPDPDIGIARCLILPGALTESELRELMKDVFDEEYDDSGIGDALEYPPDGDWSLYEDYLNGIKYGMKAKWTQVMTAIRQTITGVIQGKFTRVLTFEAFSGGVSTGVGCACPDQCGLYALTGIQDAYCDSDLLKIINETYYVAGYDAEGDLETIGVVESCPGATPAQDTSSQARDAGCGVALTIVSQIGCDDDEYVEDNTAAYYPRVAYFMAVGKTSGWLTLMECAQPTVCPEDCSEMPATLYVTFPSGVDCGMGVESTGGTSTLVHQEIPGCAWLGTYHTDAKFEAATITCVLDQWDFIINGDIHSPHLAYKKIIGNTPVGTYLLEDSFEECPDAPTTLEVYA